MDVKKSLLTALKHTLVDTGIVVPTGEQHVKNRDQHYEHRNFKYCKNASEIFYHECSVEIGPWNSKFNLHFILREHPDIEPTQSDNIDYEKQWDEIWEGWYIGLEITSDHLSNNELKTLLSLIEIRVECSGVQFIVDDWVIFLKTQWMIAKASEVFHSCTLDDEYIKYEQPSKIHLSIR